MEWTQEQRRVIETRGCSLLVSAAAGSGKTAVLVQRILSMLTDAEHPADIDRLLIVTFTNAAAGEMRDRIRAAIERQIEQTEPQSAGKEQMLDHLTKQVSLLLNAQITTIHSFCQHIIRNHFHTIDLDPGLRIADDGEQLLVQNEVMERVLEDCYREADASFLWMAECLAPGRSDAPLAETVKALYRFSRSFPYPDQWFEKCLRQYEGIKDPDSTDWIRPLMELADTILREALDAVRAAKATACMPDGPYPYLDAIGRDETQIEALLAADTYRKRSEAMQGLCWTRLSGKRDERISEEKKEQVKALRADYKKTVSQLADDFFSAPPEVSARQMEACAPVIKALLELTKRFAGSYAEEKQKKNMMDFDDLEHFALQILVEQTAEGPRRTPVAEEYADRFEEILIDEYQDSNLVQEMLLSAVSRVSRGQNNIFMVGDVKQSIYRFRLARPELFMEKYGAYSTDGQGREQRIDLHKNFRSRRQVLNSVNFLFEQLMEKKLGNIDYDEAAALYPGAEFAPHPEEFYRTEVLLIDTKAPGEQGGAGSPQNAATQKDGGSPQNAASRKDGGPPQNAASRKDGGSPQDAGWPEEEDEADETARELEARAVAGRIRGIVGKEQIWDHGAYRPARYGDIVILLRTMQGWSDVFVRMLTDLGIPAYAGSRTGYFSTTEVQTVLSLLKVIDNPRQDIALTAVLHSPIVGLSGAELAGIRSRHRDLPFYEACLREESLGDFFAMLEEFRAMASYTPIYELLWHILERTGYGAYAAAMPGGKQRSANLDMLVEKAIAYEKGSYRGLYNFVRYIENLHKYDVDFGEAAVGEQENAVCILSIHKSKGLEFPIVFVCGMGKQFNNSDTRSGLVLHADLGIGADCVDPVRRTRTGTLLKHYLQRQTLHENLGEELRVLYVALTRAKEKLILTGTVCGAQEKLRKRWGGICGKKEPVVPFTARASAQVYWDWILPALMRNKCFADIAEECGIWQDKENPLYAREIDTDIRILGTDALVREEGERQTGLALTREELLNLPEDAVFDAEAAKRLEENLTFCYTYESEINLPAKLSVSELKRMAMHAEEEDGELVYEEPCPVPLVPDFLQKKSAVSGAARGTIYHRVMECLDFAGLLDRDTPNVDGLLEELCRDGKLTAEEWELVSKEEARQNKIGTFLRSSLAKRMMRAAADGRLFREQPFVMSVPASSLNSGWSTDTPVLVQGIIDAWFIEDGRIVLLDYKTDRVKPGCAGLLYQKYKEQLNQYQNALERLSHRKVKEKLIYSFCLNCVIEDGENKE